MKASLTKLQTVSITSAHSLSAFCTLAGFVDVNRVLRQLHCDKHKADPFSLDTLHLHHFSVMSLTSILCQPGNVGGKRPFSRADSFLQISQISVKSGRVRSTIFEHVRIKAPN